MRGLAIIAGLTWREAVRRRIVLVAFLVGLAFLVLFGLGLYLIATRPALRLPPNPVIRRQIMIGLMMVGLYAVNWLVVLMTVLASVDTLSGEISSGTMQSLATKPLPRWQIVAGKWLGFAALLTVFLLFMSGGVIAEVSALSGRPPGKVPGAIALMWLESMLLLAVSFRAGASLSTLATGVTALGLHILAFLGGFIEEFGSLAGSATAVQVGVVASLIMPSEALWRRAASELQGPILGGFGRNPFSTQSVPSDAMVVYAAVYLAAALGWALRRFSRRDL